MKILYFTNKPAPYRVEFFNQLNKENQVTVLFDYNNNDDRNPMWYKDNNYNFEFVNIKKYGLFQLNKILRNNKYDIVVIGTYATLNGAFLNILLKTRKIEFFINADGGFIASKESFISKKLKTMFLSKADYYLSTGKETNKYLIYYGAKKEKIFIYPFTSLNKSDILSEPIQYEEKMKMRRRAGYNYNRLFISVGSFIYRKGYDIFLDSIRNSEFKSTGFLIIGGGENKNEYLKYISDNNIKNVHIIDFCQKKDILDYYKMSDVFFCPSREDIWGLVINEAMSCGLPVISSDMVLASKELLCDTELYECLDSRALNRKIEAYINRTNDVLYDEGMINLNKICSYTIENTVKRHLEIFEKVIDEKK